MLDQGQILYKRLANKTSKTLFYKIESIKKDIYSYNINSIFLNYL